VYALGVYLFHDQVSAAVFIAAALGLIALRLLFWRSPIARLWRLPLAVAAAVIMIVALADQHMATKTYPVVMSLAAASVFASSLVRPPSLIERFARIRRPVLADEAVAYCRKLTVVWAGWLVVNAAVAAALGEWASLQIWTLWTGVLSYLGSGALFFGEMVFRRLFVERSHRP
jgi:uncharacterized membrane protein